MIAIIVFDIVYQKNIKSKNDIIFYVICIIIAILIAIYYYSSPSKDGIAEYILKIFPIEGD